MRVRQTSPSSRYCSSVEMSSYSLGRSQGMKGRPTGRGMGRGQLQYLRGSDFWLRMKQRWSFRPLQSNIITINYHHTSPKDQRIAFLLREQRQSSLLCGFFMIVAVGVINNRMEAVEQEEQQQSHEQPQDIQDATLQAFDISAVSFPVKYPRLRPPASRCKILAFPIAITLGLIVFLYFNSLDAPQTINQTPSISQITDSPSTPAAFTAEQTHIQNDINQGPDQTTKNQQKPKTQNEVVGVFEANGSFRRIVWVQTDDQLQSKQMEVALAAQNIIHFSKQVNYTVRIVNNYNAYDWLSQRMISLIKDTHQKSRIDLSVFQLLRLALLFEHGGVAIRLPNLLLMEGLDWVEELMEGKEMNEGVLRDLPGGQIVIHHQERKNGVWFKDTFIAAKPQSPLIEDLLKQIGKIVKKGVWPYLNHNITTVDKDTEAVTFPAITETLINIFQEDLSRQNSSLFQHYGLISFDSNQGNYMKSLKKNTSASTFKGNQDQFAKTHGKQYLLRVEMSELVNDIIHIIKTGQIDSNSMLHSKLMGVEGNRWLTIPKPKIRQVHFCIVSLIPQPIQDYQQMTKKLLDHLAQQTFTDWNLVSFVKDLPNIDENNTGKVIFVNASAYEGLNLQRAATRYCSPASVILLLDHDETLSTEGDLQALAKHFREVEVFAAFFQLKVQRQGLSPNLVIREVRRRTNKPNRLLLSEIGNLMRAFTVQSYRFIAAFDLRHSSGRYFDREIPLLAMLELSEHFSPCENSKFAYQVRRLQERMTIPKKRVLTSIAINSVRIRIADITRFEYFGKFRHRHLCGTIRFFHDYVAPVEALAVFNNGTEEAGLAARKGLPQIIPRKIHQIWVRGEIPHFKQFLMKRLRDSHPDYQYFLWTEDNITRENFPQGYELMQTIMEWDKRSPYNKMSVISDIIRSEAVHAHGGFYLDTNYMLFGDHALDQFLTYSFVTAGELSPRQRMFRDTAIFGAARHCPRLARLISHRTLSARNFYSKRAAKEAGPGLFGRALRGEEELAKDVFQAGFEEFYPNFNYDPGNSNLNRCEAKGKVSQSEILFKSSQKSYLKRCPSIYPYAFGLDYFGQGLSWQKRRWK